LELTGRLELPMDTFLQDLRYAVRRLVSSPLITIAAVAIVGVGIAANTFVFSAVNAFLIRPLPFEDAGRLVNVYQDSDEGQPDSSSFPAYRAIAERQEVFSSAAAVFYFNVNAESDLGVRQSLVEIATSSYLPVLGLRPLIGRWFSPEEDSKGSPSAVVSYHAWRTRFGADPQVIGRTVRLGGSSATIVGVGPQDYNGSLNGIAVDFWLPLSSLGPVMGSYASGTLERPQDHWFQIRARVREGITVAQAQAAMDGVSTELATRFAGLDQRRHISVIPTRQVHIHPSLDGALVPAAALLLGFVGLVLALVCSNLAILLLLRGAGQHRDVSIRLAMGATRGRIVRQYLTESVVLSLAGGLAGALAAQWLLGAVSTIDVPVANGLLDASIDYRVLAFATTLSLLTGLAFGMAPALRAIGTDVTGVLNGLAGARRRVAFKYALVGVQVALSMVLLVAAGLVVRSVMRTEQVDVGFNRARLALVSTSAAQAGYQPNQGRRVLQDVEARIAVLPGVQSVVRASVPPLGRRPTNTLVIPQYVSPTGTNTAEVPGAFVSPNYFSALQIPIEYGRAFRPEDNVNAPAVAIVSEAMARRYWGRSNVVGERYRHDGAPDSWVEIVGVARDVKVSTLTETASSMYYRSLEQQGSPNVSFLVRTAGDPKRLATTLGRVIHEVDSRLPILQQSTIEEYLARQLLVPRLGANILSGFSLVALGLAALGLYAVVAFAVGERARDVGIRMALGARAQHVIWTTIRGVMLTVVIGLVTGLMLAAGAAQAMRSILFRVSPTDGVTLAVVTALLASVAVLAAVIPARRAAHVDPLVVLRYQ
jgi:predicted permease